MCKGTGRNGRRKDIGTGTVIRAVVGTGIKVPEDMVIKTTEGMVIRTAENVVTETVVDTKNGIKWMMDWDLMSDSKVYFSLY